MQSLSSLDLYFLLKELDIVPSKIDQIYQKDKEELLLQMHKTGEGKFLLRISLPGMIYLSRYKGDQPTEPPGFCRFLRKRLKNAWLQSIQQKGFERILDLLFSTKDARYHLIIELFSDGNMILTDEDYKIISPLNTGNWKDRTIRGGVIYTYPKRDLDLLSISEDDFTKAIKASDKESIVKALALDFGLGGYYSEHLCKVAKVSKDIRPGEKDIEKVSSLLYKSSRELLELSPRGFIKGDKEKTIHPIKIDGCEENFPSFSQALDETLTKDKVNKEHSEETGKRDKEIGKIQRIIQGQKKTIEEIEAKIEENTKKGEAIYSNFQIIDDVLSSINKARNTHSWQEIKDKLKGHKLVKGIDPKEKTVTIELD